MSNEDINSNRSWWTTAPEEALQVATTRRSVLKFLKRIPVFRTKAITNLWRYHAEITANNIHEAEEYAEIIEKLTLSDETVFDEISSIHFPNLKHLRLRNVRMFPREMDLTSELEIFEFDGCDAIYIDEYRYQTAPDYVMENIFTDTLLTFLVSSGRRKFNREEKTFIQDNAPNARIVRRWW
ncbi:hypothetical protein BJV82DRAFT_665299 [Fennellomyces sp. T-0311]|nr:hypothetical protein BJV82DRAFT_665299 [Fennellomyces sp. T-0311]